jgi:hypothetical protein
MDLRYFGKLDPDPDPRLSLKLDPYAHLSLECDSHPFGEKQDPYQSNYFHIFHCLANRFCEFLRCGIWYISSTYAFKTVNQIEGFKISYCLVTVTCFP